MSPAAHGFPPKEDPMKEDEFEFVQARDDLVPTGVSIERQGITISFSPEVEKLIVASRDALHDGEDFEAYSLLGLAIDEAIDEEARQGGPEIVAAFIVMGVAGALIASIVWAIVWAVWA